MSLTVGGGAPISTAYTAGAFASITNVAINAFQTFTVEASWTGFPASPPFTEFDVDFTVYAGPPGSGGGEVPLPATAVLLLGALGGLGFMARKRS